MSDRALQELLAREALALKEKQENAPFINKAKLTGKAVSFIASDGCEVTCLPDGTVLFNSSDWW